MKNIFLIIIIVFLHSCGFTPIYSSKDSNYKIISLQKNINNNLTDYIQDSITMLSNEDAEKVLKIRLNFSEDIVVILKDSKGDPKKNRLSINVDLQLFDKEDNLTSSQKFFGSFEYSIDDNKFNLKQYEKNIKQNLVEEISQQINAFLAQIT
tara:strand:- start:2265 stop:2720 length:456 start_codon:yes stop_codon:yes gene_type:complete